MSCRVQVRRPNLLDDYETEHHLVYVIRVSTRYNDQSGAWCIMDKCIVSQFRVGVVCIIRRGTKLALRSNSFHSDNVHGRKNCGRKLRRGG
jgi:hypothetical protein